MAADRVTLLDENTANRIAAGEVVERPASAVKELVENAIDAGATQITVTLIEGGKQGIRVVDNGFGMTRNDAVLALQRHATSKISSADDLFAIRTLGFRGEAMPSIASVSQMTLISKQSDCESGIELRIQGGDIVSIEEVASRDGTTIEVNDLFFNTPARLKFLKSTPSEVARCIEIVGHLAAAYPQISLRLHNGGHEVFATPGTGEPLAALAAVWGRDIARKLIPIHQEGLGLSVSGWMATPDTSRPGRSHELFFVNRRPIKSRLLSHALEDAVRSLTPDSRYPIAAVFVEIQPDLVDVNVHPTKTEVKFTRDGEVHHAVSQAVKNALLAYGIVPRMTGSVTTPALAFTPFANGGTQGDTGGRTGTEIGSGGAQSVMPLRDYRGFSEPAPSSEGYTSTAESIGNGRSQTSDPASDFSGEVSREFSSIPNAGDEMPLHAASILASFAAQSGTRDTGDTIEHGGASGDNPQASGIFASAFSSVSTSELSSDSSNSCADDIQETPRPRPFADQLRDFKVLGQARNTYIVALTPDGLAVIDQHVAHERVLYERLTVKRFANGIPVQRLAVPLTLELARREALLLGEHCAAFASAGWEIAPFGKESFVVRAIPAMLTRKPYERILRDMIDELVNQTISRRLLVQQEHVTITNACKMAVKAGDPLTIPEMEGLLEQLAETENPYLCPHGRPIVVTIGFSDIDKLFKRA